MPNNENVNRTKADERIRRAFSKMSHMLGSILNGLKHKSSYYAATYFCITKIITYKSSSQLPLLLQPTIFTFWPSNFKRLTVHETNRVDYSNLRQN